MHIGTLKVDSHLSIYRPVSDHLLTSPTSGEGRHEITYLEHLVDLSASQAGQTRQALNLPVSKVRSRKTVNPPDHHAPDLLENPARGPASTIDLLRCRNGTRVTLGVSVNLNIPSCNAWSN